MVGRSFLEALRFGAPGGALVPWIPVWISTPIPGEVNVMTESVGAIVLATSIGAIVGVLVAYPALLLGAMAADVSDRRVGVAVGLLVTLAGSFVLVGPRTVSPWVAVPLGVAAYGALIAWFRIPKILAR